MHYVVYNHFGTRDGSNSERAYAEGFQARKADVRKSKVPYTEPVLASSWLLGWRDADQKFKLRSQYRQGELRNKSFQRPPLRDAQDFKSERGYQAKVFSSTGGVVATSPPYLKELTAQQWLSKKVDQAIAKGYRVSGKVFPGFFDPYQLKEA